MKIIQDVLTFVRRAKVGELRAIRSETEKISGSASYQPIKQLDYIFQLDIFSLSGINVMAQLLHLL
jgi:hypothetical protein